MVGTERETQEDGSVARLVELNHVTDHVIQVSVGGGGKLFCDYLKDPRGGQYFDIHAQRSCPLSVCGSNFTRSFDRCAMHTSCPL
jgi:hypothetical protein